MPFNDKTKREWKTARDEIVRCGVKLDALEAASSMTDLAGLRAALGLAGKDPGLLADVLQTLEAWQSRLSDEASTEDVAAFDPGFAAEHRIIADGYSCSPASPTSSRTSASGSRRGSRPRRSPASRSASRWRPSSSRS